MRKFFALSMAVMLTVASSGCGPSRSDQADRRTEAERQQALRDSAFGTAAVALERAREVEQLQQDRKSELEAALESAEGR